mmetsp:Transcript_6053/g.16310  ORF Transcript_6053/g.16310 Transcript_6053/m.16310 type:complete len:361 (+) Transcript_6053:299-1381(+)
MAEAPRVLRTSGLVLDRLRPRRALPGASARERLRCSGHRRVARQLRDVARVHGVEILGLARLDSLEGGPRVGRGVVADEVAAGIGDDPGRLAILFLEHASGHRRGHPGQGQLALLHGCPSSRAQLLRIVGGFSCFSRGCCLHWLQRGFRDLDLIVIVHPAFDVLPDAEFRRGQSDHAHEQHTEANYHRYEARPDNLVEVGVIALFHVHEQQDEDKDERQVQEEAAVAEDAAKLRARLRLVVELRELLQLPKELAELDDVDVTVVVFVHVQDDPLYGLGVGFQAAHVQRLDQLFDNDEATGVLVNLLERHLEHLRGDALLCGDVVEIFILVPEEHRLQMLGWNPFSTSDVVGCIRVIASPF